MGFTRNYSPEHKFMLTQLTGDINDENLLEHVLATNEETRGIAGLREFADCCGVTSLDFLSVLGTAKCGDREDNKPGSRLAILVPEGSWLVKGMAGVFQVFSEDHREAVKLFTNRQEALAWLAADDDDDDFDLLARLAKSA